MNDIITTKIIIDDDKIINVDITKTEYDAFGVYEGDFYAAKILIELQKEGFKIEDIRVKNYDKYITFQDFIEVCKISNKDIIKKGYIKVYTTEFLNYYNNNKITTKIIIDDDKIINVDITKNVYDNFDGNRGLFYAAKILNKLQKEGFKIEDIRVKNYDKYITFQDFIEVCKISNKDIIKKGYIKVYTTEFLNYYNTIIIGAGVNGLHTAIKLKNETNKICVIDKREDLFALNQVVALNTGGLLYISTAFNEKETNNAFLKEIKKYTCLTPFPWFTADTLCIKYDDDIIQHWDDKFFKLIQVNESLIRICGLYNIFVENKCLVPSIRLGDLNRVLCEFAEKIGVVILKNKKIDNIDTDNNSISTTDNNSISTTDNANASNKSVYRYNNSLIFTTGRLKEPSDDDDATKTIREIMGFNNETNPNKLYNLRSPEMTSEKLNIILNLGNASNSFSDPYEPFDIPREESFDCYGFAAIFKVLDSEGAAAYNTRSFTSDEFEDLTDEYKSLLKFSKAQHRIRFFMEPDNEVYIGIQISRKEYETYVEQRKTLSLDNIELINLGKNYIKAIYHINGKEDVEVITVDKKNSYNVFNSSPHIVKNPFCFKENAKGVKTVYGFIGDAALSANFATAGGINVGTFFAHALLSNAIESLPNEVYFENINKSMKKFMRKQLFQWSWEIYHDNIYKIEEATKIKIEDLKREMGGYLIDKDNDKKLIEKLGEEEFKKICFSTLKNSEIRELLNKDE